MCVTFYTVDDLRPGRSTGWSIRRFQALKDAISHYRTLPAERTRILGMADESHVWETDPLCPPVPRRSAG